MHHTFCELSRIILQGEKEAQLSARCCHPLSPYYFLLKVPRTCDLGHNQLGMVSDHFLHSQPLQFSLWVMFLIEISQLWLSLANGHWTQEYNLFLTFNRIFSTILFWQLKIQCIEFPIFFFIHIYPSVVWTSVLSWDKFWLPLLEFLLKF